jgi:tetratricopeptide (TPR) repeat protein
MVIATTRFERWRTLACVLAAAFAVKLAVLLQLHDHPLLRPHGELDTAYYVELGHRIASGGIFAVNTPFFVAPLYGYFLALIFALDGSLMTAMVIQIGLGAVAVGLLFATARHWFGARAAVAAASLAILTGLFTFYEVLILPAALDPFLVSCALCLLTRTRTTAGLWVFAAAGTTLGLFALNRPNALAYAAVAGVLVAWDAWRRTDVCGSGSRPHRWWKRAGGTLVFGTCLLLIIATNALRNYAVSGDVVPIASHGGLNFYIGNSANADGTYTPVPGISPSIAGQARDATRVAEAAKARRLSPSEVSDYFYQRAWAWIRAHPANALRLFTRKVAILLNRTNVPLNFSYAYYAREESSVLRLLSVGPWLLVPLGLVGLCWPALRSRQHGYWVWGAFVPVFGLSVAAFFVSSRYRMPLLVPLCATAGALLVRLFDDVRGRRGASVLVPVAAVAVMATVVNWNLGLDDGLGSEQTRKAVWLVEQGNYDEARRYVTRITPQHSHPGVLAYRFGGALSEAGQYADAAESLRRALAIDGARPAILLELGQALVGAGRASEAVPHLAAAYDMSERTDMAGPLLVRALILDDRPDEAVARLSTMPETVAGDGVESALDFGTLALERGAVVEAERWLRLAAGRAPQRAEAVEKLGLSFFLQHRALEALPLLEQACRLAPTSASAHLNLAAVYADLRRFTDARQQAEATLRLEPSEVRAHELLKALPPRTP